MGCDIHIYTERIVDGKWVPFGEVTYNREGEIGLPQASYRGRNYALFGILAGVRSGITPETIDVPRGLPADISGVIYHLIEDVWGCDGHSRTYFTVAELLVYRKRFEKESIDFMKFLDDLVASNDPDKTRLIIFFDN